MKTLKMRWSVAGMMMPAIALATADARDTVGRTPPSPGARPPVDGSRMSAPDPALYTKEQSAAVAEAALLLQAKSVEGPFTVWVRTPSMLRAGSIMIDAQRHTAVLKPRTVRLVGIAVAREWNAQYEWGVQAAYARRAGISDDVIEAIRLGRKPELADGSDQVAYDAAVELSRHHDLSAKTFRRAQTLFGDDGVAELINSVGTYTVIAITVKANAMKALDPLDPNPLPPRHVGRK